ncbi:unnamed protein product [Symbiodinium natans]|uniref:Reverse transcriptase Ty1/copia-type domain-containing protein n=1 Tax=Symbiodinium natans TaxID=878477 RepID=A0A812PPC7_9DINO|nr:unnamed protein product [Symbiodinium natans]
MGDSPELVPTEVATDLGTDGFTDAESAEMDLSGTLAMPPSTDGRGLVLEENAAAANVFAPNAPSPFVGLGAPQIHMYRQQFQQNITIGETPEQTRLLLTELENEAESRHQRFRLAAEEAHDQQIADVEERANRQHEEVVARLESEIASQRYSFVARTTLVEEAEQNKRESINEIGEWFGREHDEAMKRRKADTPSVEVPVTRANAQETKPWLKGKAKVIKTLPVSPYTAKENWDWKEGRGETGDKMPWTGKTVFKIKEQNKKAFAGAAEERDPVVEHPDPEISAAINEEEYLVTPVKGCDFAFEIGNFPILRSKRMELLPGDFTFPMRSEQLALQESLRKPTLSDQDCSWGGTDGAGPRAPPGDSPDEPLPPPGVPDLDGSDLKDRLSEYLDQVAKENEDYVPEDVGAVEDWLGRDAPGSSKAQREADIERFERKKAREAEEDARKALRDSPAMPVIAEPDPEPHRDRMASLYWAKLGQVASEMFAAVARVVGPKEIESTPAAKEAMDREWKKLADKSCWLEKKVREYRDVAAEAKHKNVKAHFGKIFEICSVKGDELPDGHPQKKWKGRSVFQGNNVQDENHDHAIFAELGSSPASMEAGKIIDVFGSQPGYVKQQADGIAAYTQALFKGIETWVRLPRNRWPKEWSGYEDPVCPLRLALYGHPDSGGIWERYCTEQLESVGFTAVLPDIWHSVFYHAELDLLLVVYVDDFKMAGPQDKINKGWELIAKVIDMEPAEVLGRYFGCHHVEQNQVQLSREDHPFAYVFDKKHASPAADYQVRPNRKEDFWEVDAELAAVVRHHIYPRRLVDWENIFPYHRGQ